MEGFIKLHRGLLESEIFASQIGLKIWIWILLKASYKQRYVPLKIGKGETIVKLERGELLFGRFSAEETLNIDGSAIYKWIKKMADMKMITLQSNNHYTIIKVNNYDTYNDYDNKESNNQVTAIQQPSNTYKKDKKVKENKEINNVKNWKNDFQTYLNELREAYKQILTPEFISEYERYYQNIDVKLTLEKSIKEYWALEDKGWKNKKAKRKTNIDWKATFINILKAKENRIYKPKTFTTSEPIQNRKLN